ncbi:hypothetical protein [Marinicellulosiphila megalodicopiae]|uniref:hypothetical protein n=1 Tax=Marinicellulosiphila megalodicopiae TaxID=2724896 RepID=UPI003BB1C10F
MRSFKGVDLKTTQNLRKQFPQLIDRLCDDGFNYDSRVCIFDHFLNAQEAVELMDKVSLEERTKRDASWHKFYEAIVNNFDIFIIKYAREKLIFKSPRNNSLAIKRLDLMESAGYISFVIPVLDLYYEQGWDATHIVYYQEPNKLECLKSIVKESGLYWL